MKWFHLSFHWFELQDMYFFLLRLLRSLKFRYTKRGRDALLIEKSEIVYWRRSYLRDIRRHRQSGRTIYYLDETWLNAGHTIGKVWKDTTVSSSKDAFQRGLTTGLKNPSGKGKRLIILHIGSNKEFVPGGLFVFESSHTGDYHEEMNAEVFESWLTDILPELDPDSLIVLDLSLIHISEPTRPY